MNFWRTSIGVALCLSLNATVALAQSSPPPAAPGGGLFQGTPEEQKACQRDSIRFCKDAVPDTFRVLACLQHNRTKISKPCLAVLESHGQ